MNAVPSQFNDTHRTGRGRAFSMTELLVVIAIIAVLAGILLVALKGVRERALATQTRATMQEFSKACDSFQIEHGRYPGIIPEGLLASNHKLSGTENALLDMMGGVVRGDHPNYSAFTDPDGWKEIVVNSDTPLGQIKVNLTLIGNGPEINGTPYSPYFTPKGTELVASRGQANAGSQSPGAISLPDLVDAWGQPIIYLRRVRPVGDLVGVDDSTNPQFMLGTMKPYINSGGLGEFGQSQFNPDRGSILRLAADDDEKSRIFAQIIRHPSFGAPNESLAGTARGAYVLISAGKDGVYFSVADGPGTPQSPIYGNGPDSLDFNEFMLLGPKVIDEFDDLRLFGGG
ncbi:MAG: type II secretion system protein [Planctomycetes bacterium]|nr:type II secretion system protein [Planctomycetota bacterium]